MACSVGVVLINSRADGIFAVALVGHRSHCNVHLLSIAAEDDGTRAVASRGKIHKLFRRPLSLSIAILILVANDAVGSPEVQIAVVNCHSEDAVQSLGVGIAHVGNAVIVVVAKNDDRAGSGLGNEQIPIWR